MRLFSHLYVPAVTSALFLVPLIGCAPTTPPAEDAGTPPTPEVDAGNPQDAGQEDVAPPPVDSGPPTPQAECGNSIVEPGEDCDDGNQTQTDACRNDCRFNVCGDGFLYANQEQCDDSNTVNGDGCSAVCLNEPPPLPPSVRLTGQILNRKYVEGNYLAQAKVLAYGTRCGQQPNCPSDQPSSPDGRYVLSGLPPQAALILQLRLDERNGDNEVPDAFVTRTRAATYANAEETVNLASIEYEWFAQTAYECGVYADLATAKGNPSNLEFIRFSHVLGQLQDVNGNGVPNIHKDRLEVEIDGYVNDTNSHSPSSFCWLEAYDDDNNPDTPSVYRGTTSQTSFANGNAAFVIFNVTNQAGNAGTGLGTQFIRVKYQAGSFNFGEQSMPAQGGVVSMVTLSTDADVTPPPIVDLVDFNTQIYPTFTSLDCVACHKPDGAYPSLDLSAQPDDVYYQLTSPTTECAPPARPEDPRDPFPWTPNGERVCVNYPKRAKIAFMPLLRLPVPVEPDPEEGTIPESHPHPYASFADENDPTLRLYEAWMEQGAPRYANPTEPVLEEIPLSSVMNVATNIGCTACHGAATIASGGLSLDGCIPNLDTNGDGINDYEAAGININGETNANYKEDCVYYHLRQEPVDNDPYGFGYRVNPESPDYSMLLRYPYCSGPDADNNGIGDACNDEVAYPVPQHPHLLFDREGGNYLFFKSYIQGLYQAPVEDAGPVPGDGGPGDGGPVDAGPTDGGPADAGN